MAVDPSQSKIPRFGDTATCPNKIPILSALNSLKTPLTKPNTKKCLKTPQILIKRGAVNLMAQHNIKQNKNHFSGAIDKIGHRGDKKRDEEFNDYHKMMMETDDPSNSLDITKPQSLLDCSVNDDIILKSSPHTTNKNRYSFGLDLTDCSLDCSIELCDISSQSSNIAQPQQLSKASTTNLTKQNSFEVDESLGILTPDQMKEFLDSATTNNLDLPLDPSHSQSNKLNEIDQCRIDQTPSPEELPLDPISVKTDISDVVMDVIPSVNILYHELSQADSDSKIEQMTKSSKVSNSFITSITSITSLDTGYQGDGEMSRPASRGADHSPSVLSRLLLNQPKMVNNNSNVNMNERHKATRRPEPMTDSDFFTESDADDVFHRGDRRAQVIDGQLYGPLYQPSNVFINQQNVAEDSCMESSGIFTDGENRAEDDLLNHLNQPRHGNENILSPDTSSDTLRSNASECSQNMTTPKIMHTSTTGFNNSDSNHSLIRDMSFGSLKSNTNDDDKNVIVTTSIISGTSSSSMSGGSSNSNINSNKKINSNRKTSKNEVNINLKTYEMTKRVINNYNSKMNNNSASCCVGSSSSVSNSKRNQENKQQTEKHNIMNRGSGYPSPTSSNSLTPYPHRKMQIANKWEVIMNKIEQNKTVKCGKLNFSDVKSKVSSGRTISKSATIGKELNSPIIEKGSRVTSSKKILMSNNRRGRTYSKDSQQSSQSDLSVSTTPKSTKSLSNTTHSAKKRDVRTISSSPSDLGPPNKTIGTPHNNNNNRTIAIQKGVSPNISNNSPINNNNNNNVTVAHNNNTNAPHGDLKNSSPATKKIVPRRLIQQKQNIVKLPLKDQNRLNGPPLPHTGSNNKLAVNVTRLKSLKSSPLHNSVQQQQQCYKKCDINSENNSRNLIECNVNVKDAHNKIATTPSHETAANDYNSCRITIELSQTKKVNEVLGVIIQHLAFNLDAFSCPDIKARYEKTKKNLLESQILLEDTRATCQSLQEQIVDKEALFAAKEIEVAEQNRQEINKAESTLTALENSTREKIKSLETELVKQKEVAEKNLSCVLNDLNVKLEAEKLTAKLREDELLRQIADLSVRENELRDKIVASETDFGERLRVSANREKELIDTIRTLNNQINQLKDRFEQTERELGEKLSLSQDELSILRNSRSSNSTSSSSLSDVHTLGSKLNGTLINHDTSLLDEVDSLRIVLELKQHEISDLRKQSQEYQRETEKLAPALFKITALESRIEDLQMQLSVKLEQEKEFQQKIKQFQDSYDQEIKRSSRLSLRNEELLYRLKQNSEKYNHVLNEFSKSYQDSSFNTNTSRSLLSELESSSSVLHKTNNKSDEFFEMEDISPPASPIIKGVVERGDSVSYVLEIDDEKPEAAAQRLVRRAGSFRSGLNEKYTNYPIPKRQRCQLNSLSQSASATAIFKTSNGKCNGSTNNKLQVESSSSSKRIMRSNSQNNSTIKNSWHDTTIVYSKKSDNCLMRGGENGLDTINSSTPVRDRAASFSCDENFEDFTSKYPVKRITCNTASLVTTRDELCPTLPSLPSVQDLKKIQSNNIPKESAGEAMVSGSNSEDETSSLGGSTPMEVSWSEDGEQFNSESIV